MFKEHKENYILIYSNMVSQEEIDEDNEIRRVIRNPKRRERYANNREHEKATTRAYYKENKEHLNQKISCGCSGRYTRINYSTHTKSKQHLNWLLWTNQRTDC